MIVERFRRCCKASPQGNRAQEQGISTAFFHRSPWGNPQLLDQIRRLNCSCIRRFNCDIYESTVNISAMPPHSLYVHCTVQWVQKVSDFKSLSLVSAWSQTFNICSSLKKSEIGLTIHNSQRHAEEVFIECWFCIHL